MEENNFKKLQDENQAPPHVQKEIRQHIDDNIGFIRFILDIVDLYVPKVMQLFTTAASNGVVHHNDPASNIDHRNISNIDRSSISGVNKMNIDNPSEDE